MSGEPRRANGLPQAVVSCSSQLKQMASWLASLLLCASTRMVRYPCQMALYHSPTGRALGRLSVGPNNSFKPKPLRGSA